MNKDSKLKKHINFLKKHFEGEYIKTISIILIIGLLLPSISSVGMFAVDNMDLKRFDKNSMDIYFNIAENMETERQWREVVESRLNILRAEWEKDSQLMIDKQIKKEIVAGTNETEVELKEKYDQEYQAAKAEWENDSKEAVHKEFGEWLNEKIEIKWQDVNKDELYNTIEQANKEYLYATDEQGNYLYDDHGYKVIRSVETIDYKNDFLAWDNEVLLAVNGDIEEYKAKIEQDVNNIKVGLDDFGGIIDKQGTEAYLDREKELRIASFEKEREYIYKRERSNMIYTRLFDNRSMRKESESQAPDVIADKLLGETEKALEKDAEKIKQILEAEMPDGTEEDIARFNNIKLQIETVFKDGMEKWKVAEENYIAERIMWEKNTSEYLKEGEKAWEDAFKKFKEARDKWEVKLDNLIQEGIEEWSIKERELMENFTEAKANLNKYLESLKEEWESSGEGLINTINNGIEMLKNANDNIAFFRKAVENCIKTGNTGLIRDYNDSIKKWQEYRAKFAELVYDANEEYKRFISNNLEGQNNFLSTQISLEEFRNILGKFNESAENYYVFESMPQELSIMDRINALNTDDQEEIKEVLGKYYDLDANNVYRIKNNINLTNDEKYIIYYNLNKIGYPKCDINRNLFPKEVSFNALSSMMEAETIDYKKYYIIEDDIISQINVNSINSNLNQEDQEAYNLIMNYYTPDAGRPGYYVLEQNKQVPNEVKYKILKLLNKNGVNTSQITCSLDETLLHSKETYANLYEQILIKTEALQLLNKYYSKDGNVYVLKDNIDAAEKQKLLVAFDWIGYSGFKYDNDLLERYRQSGILTDYDVELIKLRGMINYWEERLNIVQEVINYSEELKSSKDVKEETLQQYQQAENELVNAKAYYEKELKELEAIAVELEAQKELVEENALALSEAEQQLQAKKQVYMQIYETLKSIQTGIDASMTPFHEQYCNLLVSLKTAKESRLDYYSLLLENNYVSAINEHYENLTKIINGNEEQGYKGLNTYREIKDSFNIDIKNDLANFNQSGIYDYQAYEQIIMKIVNEVFGEDNAEIKNYIEKDDITINYQTIDTRISEAYKQKAIDFVNTIKNLKKASKYINGQDIKEYTDDVKIALFDFEKAYLILKNACESDFNVALAKVWQQLGDGFTEYDDKIGFTSYTDTQLYSDVLNSLGYGTKQDIVQLKSNELTFRYDYNNQKINDYTDLINQFKDILNNSNIEGYADYKAVLNQLKEDFIEKYSDNADFTEIEKSKALYDLFNKYYTEYLMNNYYQLSIAGLEKVTNDVKDSMKQMYHSILGILGILNVTDVKLTEQEIIEFNDEEKAYYDVITGNGISEDTKEQLKKQLIKDYEGILIILGYINKNMTEEEKAKINAEINSNTVSYINELKEETGQELYNLGEIKKYLNDNNAGYTLDEYIYYKNVNEYNNVLKELNDLVKNLADENVIKEKQKELIGLYEKLKYISISDSYVSPLLKNIIGVNYLNNIENLNKADMVGMLIDGVKLADNTNLFKYKNQTNNELYTDLNNIMKTGSLKELRYWIDNYFELHRGEFTSDVENMLSSLQSSFTGIDLINALVENKDDVMEFVNSYVVSDELVFNYLNEDETKGPKGKWIIKKDELKEALEKYTDKFLNITQFLNTITGKEGEVLKIETGMSDTYNPDDITDKGQIESIMDKLYMSIRELENIKIGSSETGLNLIEFMNDISAYYKSRIEKAIADFNIDNTTANLIRNGNIKAAIESGRVPVILNDICQKYQTIQKTIEAFNKATINLKNEYLNNLGLCLTERIKNRMDPFVEKNRTYYLNYLKDNEAEVNVIIGQYLNGRLSSKDKQYSADWFTADEMAKIKQTINYQFALEALSYTLYSFNEEDKNETEENVVVVKSVNEETEKILNNYNLNLEDRKKLEDYIRIDMFNSFEQELQNIDNKSPENCFDEYYYEKELVSWLENEIINPVRTDFTVETLYNDFVLKYLDRPGYVTWIENNNIITKQVMEFDSSSMLTGIYNTISARIELYNTENETEDAVLLEEAEAKWEKEKTRCLYGGLAVYFENYAEIDAPVEFKDYFDSYAMKNYLDGMNNYKEYVSSDDFKRSTNKYLYLMGKLATVTNAAEKNILATEFSDLYIPQIGNITGETIFDNAIAYLKDKYQNIIEPDDDQIKILKNIQDNEENLRNIKTDYMTVMGNEDRENVYCAKYFDDDNGLKGEFDYYMKRYLLSMNADEDYEDAIDYLDLDEAKEKELLIYGKSTEALKQYGTKNLISFEKFLDWDGLWQGYDENEMAQYKEDILNIKNNYLIDASNYLMALRNEYDVLSRDYERDNYNVMIQDYFEFKKDLKDMYQNYNGVLADAGNKYQIQTKLVDIVNTESLGTMRSFLSQLVFDTPESIASGIKNITVQKKWNEIYPQDGSGIDADDYYINGLYKNGNVNDLDDILSILRGDRINELGSLADKMTDPNNPAKKYYVPLSIDGTRGEKLFGGKLLDIFNEFYCEFESVRDNIKNISKNIQIIDEYTGYLKDVNTYDYANGIKGDRALDNIFTLKQNMTTGLYEADLSGLDVFYNNYGNAKEAEYNDRYMKKTGIEYDGNGFDEYVKKLLLGDSLSGKKGVLYMLQEAFGEASSLLNLLGYNGGILEGKLLGEQMNLAKLKDAEKDLDECTIKYNNASDAFENAKQQFNTINLQYLDKWEQVKEAYNEYMLNQKYYNAKKEIMEYAESSYVKTGSVQSNENDINKNNGTDPLGGNDQIETKEGLGMSMNLYAIKTRVEEKLKRVNYLYDQMYENYKDYSDRINELDKIVVCIKNNIDKNEFETKILANLEDADKVKINSYYKLGVNNTQYVLTDDVSTKERKELSEIFKKINYEGEVWTYSDVKEDYKEKTERYERLTKTYNDLVEKQRLLKEKEAELRNRQIEIENDMLIDIDYDNATADTEGDDTLFDHVKFINDEMVFVDEKENHLSYIFDSIGKNSFKTEILYKNTINDSDRDFISKYYVYNEEIKRYVLIKPVNDLTSDERNRLAYIFKQTGYYAYYYRDKFEAKQREDYVDFIRYINGKSKGDLDDMFMSWGMEWARDKEDEFKGESDLKDYFDVDTETNWPKILEVSDLEDKAKWLDFCWTLTIGRQDKKSEKILKAFVPVVLPGVIMNEMINGDGSDLSGDQMRDNILSTHDDLSGKEKAWYEWFARFYKGREQGQDMSKMIENAREIEIDKEKARVYNFYGTNMTLIGTVDISIGAVWSAASIAMAVVAAALSWPPAAAAAAVFYALAAVFGVIAAYYFCKGGLEMGYGIGGGLMKAMNLNGDANKLEEKNKDMISKLKKNSKKFVNLEDSLIIVRNELKKFESNDKNAMFNNLMTPNDHRMLTDDQYNRMDENTKQYVLQYYDYDEKNKQYTLKKNIAINNEAELVMTLKNKNIIGDTGINYTPLDKDENEKWNDYNYIKDALDGYEGKEVGDETMYSSIDLLAISVKNAKKDADESKNRYYTVMNNMEKEHEKKTSKYNKLAESYVDVGFNDEESAKMWVDAYNINTLADPGDISENASNLMYTDSSIPKSINSDSFETDITNNNGMEQTDKDFITNTCYTKVDTNYIFNEGITKDDKIRLAGLLTNIGYINPEDKRIDLVDEIQAMNNIEITGSQSDIEKELEDAIDDAYGENGFDYSLVLSDTMGMQKDMTENAKQTSLYGRAKMKNFEEYLNQMHEDRDPSTIVLDTDVNDNVYLYEMLVKDEFTDMYRGFSGAYIDAKGNIKKSFVEQRIDELQSRKNQIPQEISEESAYLYEKLALPQMIINGDFNQEFRNLCRSDISDEDLNTIRNLYTIFSGNKMVLQSLNENGELIFTEYKKENYEEKRVIRSWEEWGPGYYNPEKITKYEYEYFDACRETITVYKLNHKGKKEIISTNEEIYEGHQNPYVWYSLYGNVLVASPNDSNDTIEYKLNVINVYADIMRRAGRISDYERSEMNTSMGIIREDIAERITLDAKLSAMYQIKDELLRLIGGSSNNVRSWTEEDWKKCEQRLIEWATQKDAGISDDNARTLGAVKEIISYRQALVGNEEYCKESMNEYRKITELAHNRKIMQEVKIQNNEWEQKIKTFLNEKKEWMDKITSIRLRSFSEWDAMYNKMLNKYRTWKEDMAKQVQESTKKWQDNYDAFLNKKNEWINLAQNAAQTRTEEDLEEFLKYDINNKAEEYKIDDNWLKNSQNLNDELNCIVSNYTQNPLLASIMNTTSWSIDKIGFTNTALTVTEIKRGLTGNSTDIISKFNNEVKNMISDMTKSASLRAYASLVNAVEDFKKDVQKINKDTDEKIFANIFRDRSYTRKGRYWEKETIAGWSLSNSTTGYKDIEKQRVEDYRYYEIPKELLQFDVIKNEDDIRNKRPEEVSILVKLEMENMKNDMQEIIPVLDKKREVNKYGGVNIEEDDPEKFEYKKYKKSIYYHIGDSPIWDDKGKGKYSGHGEYERILDAIHGHDVLEGIYRAKYQGNFFKALEWWDSDLDNDGQTDQGNWSFSFSTIYSIITGVVSSLGSIIGSCAGGAAGAAANGIASGVGQAVAYASIQATATFAVNTATSAMDTGLSTTGADEETKKKAWGNFGINTAVNAVGCGISIGASAAGGAVSGATSRLGSVVSGTLSSLTSTCISSVGNYGLNMAANGIKYGAGEMTDEEMQYSAIYGGVSATAQIGASAATGAISGAIGDSLGDNKIGSGVLSALASWGINTLSDEGAFWITEAIMKGIYNDRDLSQTASDRYGDSTFWVNKGTSLGSDLATAIAMAAYDQSGDNGNYYGNNLTKNLIKEYISRGFNAFGGLLNTSFTGDLSYAGENMVRLLDLRDIYNSANMGVLKSGMSDLASQAGANWAMQWEAIKKEYENREFQEKYMSMSEDDRKEFIKELFKEEFEKTGSYEEAMRLIINKMMAQGMIDLKISEYLNENMSLNSKYDIRSLYDKFVNDSKNWDGFETVSKLYDDQYLIFKEQLDKMKQIYEEKEAYNEHYDWIQDLITEGKNSVSPEKILVDTLNNLGDAANPIPTEVIKVLLDNKKNILDKIESAGLYVIQDKSMDKCKELMKTTIKEIGNKTGQKMLSNYAGIIAYALSTTVEFAVKEGFYLSEVSNINIDRKQWENKYSGGYANSNITLDTIATLEEIVNFYKPDDKYGVSEAFKMSVVNLYLDSSNYRRKILTDEKGDVIRGKDGSSTEIAYREKIYEGIINNHYNTSILDLGIIKSSLYLSNLKDVNLYNSDVYLFNSALQNESGVYDDANKNQIYDIYDNIKNIKSYYQYIINKNQDLNPTFENAWGKEYLKYLISEF